MGMPVSVLKEEKIFEKIIAIKYDVLNDRLDMFDDYKKQIDDSSTITYWSATHKEGRSQWQSNI